MVEDNGNGHCHSEKHPHCHVKDHKIRTRVRPPQGCDESTHCRRLAVIRYFLDRPGYDEKSSVARLWFDPPEICTPETLGQFLKQQNIALPGLLVEVYLDQFESFLLLEGCHKCGIEWDFQDCSLTEPAILSIRLTDLLHHQDQDHPSQVTKHEAPMVATPPPHANTIPLGLFSFSIMVGLETTALLMGSTITAAVAPSFRLVWGPYMVFVGGLLQVIVGIFQVMRNNLYGAVAFLGFGCFWFANGTRVVLETYFAEGSIAENGAEVDSVGSFLRLLFILFFSCALWKQTFVMSKLSTTLITLLCLKLLVQALRLLAQREGADETAVFVFLTYLQFCVGWMTSAFAFWVFWVEFTNGVYKKQVYPTFKWSQEHSPQEAFGASGHVGTLHSEATKLRQAALAWSHHRAVVVPTEGSISSTTTAAVTHQQERSSNHCDTNNTSNANHANTKPPSE